MPEKLENAAGIRLSAGLLIRRSLLRAQVEEPLHAAQALKVLLSNR